MRMSALSPSSAVSSARHLGTSSNQIAARVWRRSSETVSAISRSLSGRWVPLQRLPNSRTCSTRCFERAQARMVSTCLSEMENPGGRETRLMIGMGFKVAPPGTHRVARSAVDRVARKGRNWLRPLLMVRWRPRSEHAPHDSIEITWTPRMQNISRDVRRRRRLRRDAEVAPGASLARTGGFDRVASRPPVTLDHGGFPALSCFGSPHTRHHG